MKVYNTVSDCEAQPPAKKQRNQKSQSKSLWDEEDECGKLDSSFSSTESAEQMEGNNLAKLQVKAFQSLKKKKKLLKIWFCFCRQNYPNSKKKKGLIGMMIHCCGGMPKRRNIHSWQYMLEGSWEVHLQVCPVKGCSVGQAMFMMITGNASKQRKQKCSYM